MLKQLILLPLLAAGVLVFWNVFKEPQKLPEPDLNECWGLKEKCGTADDGVRPYKVVFSESMLKDLRYRLQKHRSLTPPLEGVAMEYGMNTDQLQDIIKYWKHEYPFEKRQKFLNQYDQFKTNIQGLDVHFIRVRPEVKPDVKVYPLLLIHGWPGSVREYYELIPLLTTPRPGADFVFEVVLPSLPGFGFSDGAVHPGLGAKEMSIVLRNLMRRLGHKQYFIQGTNWGGGIGTAIATYFPDEVLGLHTNCPYVWNSEISFKFIVGNWFPSLYLDDIRMAERMYPLSRFFSFALEQFGYLHMQATKPDTIGVGIADSPTGLAAYILEKWCYWTDRGDVIPSHLSREGLVDNLMVYWSSNSFTTAVRIHAETFNTEGMAVNLYDFPTPVPFWVIQAKFELLYQPLSFLRVKFPNILHETVLDHGGHFLPFEEPNTVADDFFEATKAFLKWHDNKTEKTEL